MLLLVLLSFVACVGLSFFMFCLFGWSIGPWEVTLLTVFFCYTVGPAIRIIREYITPSTENGAVSLEEGDTSDERMNIGAPVLQSALAVLAPDDTGDDAAAQAARRLEVNPRAMDEESEVSSNRDEDHHGARVRRAVLLVSGTTLGAAMKMFACGVFVAPSELRLFSRVGVIGIVTPLVSVPVVLILLPAALLLIGPERKTPDLVLLWELCAMKLNELLT